MPHVDEGTLHALLDGELGAAEVLEVQTHFATCAACAARLDQARQLLAETERLVTALEPPAGGAASAPRLLVGRPMIPLDPVVLIPDNPTPTEVRRNRFKIMGWAAGFLMVVGAGFLGLEMRSAFSDRPRAGSLRIRPEDFTFAHTKSDSVAPAAGRGTAAGGPPASSPPAESSTPPKPDNTPPAAGKVTPAAPAKPAPPPAAAPTPPAQAGRSGARTNEPPAPQPPPAQKPAAPPEQKAAPTPAPPARREVAADSPAASPQPAADEGGADSGSADSEKAGRPAAAAPPPVESRSELAQRAARATEALDRERMRERAAAATAELDRERERERAAAEEAQRREAAQAEAAKAAAAQPAVPTVDQQARLSSRIGLDEAARQLGGPLHAIDGMTRQLVGLVSPQLVPGADPTRPVVRAVYVDRSGRTLYLDQQRVRPGQLDLPFTPQTGPNGQQSWMAGSVMLVLQGDLTPDSLRALARRVR